MPPPKLTNRRVAEIKRGRGEQPTPGELAKLYQAQARSFGLPAEHYARVFTAYVDGLFERSCQRADSPEELAKAQLGEANWKKTRRLVPVAVKILRSSSTLSSGSSTATTYSLAARPRERRSRRSSGTASTRGDPDPEPEPAQQVVRPGGRR